ncbi:phage holin family protein [Pigmentiphaga kullae]|uniref:Putative 3TM holin n=1 Tax=Pigmentiphaga kullae TaxID=151784 RepID=A0A4Q7NCL4_9BURK|nr:phage holin family protein [Pigmentiphaga kullae]RZS80663.1 putative 3TM holin [Pigmentiphaga kullae]
MAAIIAFVVIIANAATALRLLTYRRGPARYRLWASCAAYVLIVCTGGQALSVVVHGTPVTIWQAGVSVVLAMLAHRARGNVARIVRVAP